MFGKLNPLAHLNLQRSACVLSCRLIRTRWERGYLKDLYHRRALIGADPVISRSAQPNWNYTSEISALAHRISGENIARETIVQALTSETFYERPDVVEESSGAQPSLEETIVSTESNVELVEQGRQKLENIVKCYLRSQWPLAPEEYISATMEYLCSDEKIAQISNSLGINHLVRTAEFPPDEITVANGLRALVAVLQPERAKKFVIDNILAHLIDLPLEDILPFKNPLNVLTDYLRSQRSVEKVEPRLLGMNGVETSMPYYIAGIYADQELVGHSPGETLSIAVDLAAQESLLRLWQTTKDRLFELGNRAYSIDLSKFESPNHSLRDVCSENTDISLMTMEELYQDPLDIVNVAEHYDKAIRPEVGIPLRRRLRHFFLKGSLMKRSHRRMIVPRPFTI